MGFHVNVSIVHKEKRKRCSWGTLSKIMAHFSDYALPNPLSSSISVSHCFQQSLPSSHMHQSGLVVFIPSFT